MSGNRFAYEWQSYELIWGGTALRNGEKPFTVRVKGGNDDPDGGCYGEDEKSFDNLAEALIYIAADHHELMAGLMSPEAFAASHMSKRVTA